MDKNSEQRKSNVSRRIDELKNEHFEEEEKKEQFLGRESLKLINSKTQIISSHRVARPNVRFQNTDDKKMECRQSSGMVQKRQTMQLSTIPSQYQKGQMDYLISSGIGSGESSSADKSMSAESSFDQDSIKNETLKTGWNNRQINLKFERIQKQKENQDDSHEINEL